jgi:hypothetical protein
MNVLTSSSFYIMISVFFLLFNKVICDSIHVVVCSKWYTCFSSFFIQSFVLRISVGLLTVVPHSLSFVQQHIGYSPFHQHPLHAPLTIFAYNNLYTHYLSVFGQISIHTSTLLLLRVVRVCTRTYHPHFKANHTSTPPHNNNVISSFSTLFSPLLKLLTTSFSTHSFISKQLSFIDRYLLLSLLH